MPIKVYVQVDSDGRERPPVHTHESLAAINMIADLWLAYQNQPTHYAVGINLHRPSADFIVVSERGTGIIDLKNTKGKINGSPKTNWDVNGKGIVHAGQGSNAPRLNPQVQVRDYALRVHMKLQLLHPEAKSFFLDTLVCFTHPLTTVAKSLMKHYPAKNWDEQLKFTIIKPHEIVDQAYCFSFEAQRGKENQYQPNLLTPSQIESFMIGKKFLALVESEEIPNLMPTGEPYAWLTSIKHNRVVASYPLAAEEVSIGRDPSCMVSIPSFDEEFQYVSQKHAKITHRLGDKQIFIEDIGSSHGTYLNGDTESPVKGRKLLKWNDRIVLGGAVEGPGVCLLKLTKKRPPIPGTAVKVWEA